MAWLGKLISENRPQCLGVKCVPYYLAHIPRVQFLFFPLCFSLHETKELVEVVMNWPVVLQAKTGIPWLGFLLSVKGRAKHGALASGWHQASWVLSCSLWPSHETFLADLNRKDCTTSLPQIPHSQCQFPELEFEALWSTCWGSSYLLGNPK